MVSIFSILLIFLCLCVANFVQAAVVSTDIFSSPTDGSNVDYNTSVNVAITFNPNESTILSYVQVTQSCLSLTVTQKIWFASPSEVFALPSNYVGTCIYSGYDDLGNIVTPVTINVKGVVSFVQPAAGLVIAAGDSTIIQLSFGPTPASFDVTLNCQNFSPTSPITITDSSVYSFTIPSNFYGSNCIFQAIGTNFPTKLVSVTITQPLTFVSPTDNEIVVQNADLDIHMLTGTYTTSEIVRLALVCTNGGVRPDIVYYTLTEYPFHYPENYFGRCSLNVTSASSYLAIPEPVLFNIKYNLNIVAPSTVYIGQSFNIQIETIPLAPITGTVNLTLVCGASTVQSWSNVALSNLVTLTSSKLLSPETGCIFQTPLVDSSFIQSNSSLISISNVPLRFVRPLEDSTVLIPNPIAILINSQNVTNLTVQLNVTLSCQNSTENTKRLVITSSAFNYFYDSDYFYGACSLNITDAPSYYLIPNAVNLYLKFLLNFINPPSFLQIGQYFIVQVNPAAILPSVFNSTSIALVCNSQLIQTWQNVLYNQQVSLQLSPSVSPALLCTLSTVSDVSNVFIPAITTVSVGYYKSPIGGNIYPITQEELIEYLSQFGTGWSNKLKTVN